MPVYIYAKGVANSACELRPVLGKYVNKYALMMIIVFNSVYIQTEKKKGEISLKHNKSTFTMGVQNMNS